MDFFAKPPYLFCKLSLFCEPNGSVAPFGAVRHTTLKRLSMYVRKKGNKKAKDDLISQTALVGEVWLSPSEVVLSTVKFVLRTSEVDFAVAKSVIRSKTS